MKKVIIAIVIIIIGLAVLLFPYVRIMSGDSIRIDRSLIMEKTTYTPTHLNNTNKRGTVITLFGIEIYNDVVILEKFNETPETSEEMKKFKNLFGKNKTTDDLNSLSYLLLSHALTSKYETWEEITTEKNFQTSDDSKYYTIECSEYYDNGFIKRIKITEQPGFIND